jgi:hypothetical protein
VWREAFGVWDDLSVTLSASGNYFARDESHCFPKLVCGEVGGTSQTDAGAVV